MMCVEVSKVGPCLARIGRVLTEEEIYEPNLVEDRDFCKFKRGDECECNKS